MQVEHGIGTRSNGNRRNIYVVTAAAMLKYRRI